MGGAIELLIRYGYAIVFGAVFAEQIGLPFPSEPVLLAAGGLIGSGRLSPAAVLAAAAAASLVGDTAWYWLGRAGGPRVLGWLCRLSLEPDSCVRRTESIFAAYGARSLLIAKFVPGFSTVAPPLAGIIGMPLRAFLVFSSLGAVLWAGAFLAVGWLFSAQLELVASCAERLGAWTVALLAAAIGGYVAWKYLARQRFLRRIRMARITPEELKRRLDAGEDVLVVDVRDRLDFEAEPAIIPGALHLTTEELERRHREIPRERDIVLYCTCPSEASSARIALLLRRRGIERVRPLAGGFRAWRDHGYPMLQLTPALRGGSHD
jgi:membrane protein DedA with SNARE-associated domain/rhodanese-related sulfurtransferase